MWGMHWPRMIPALLVACSAAPAFAGAWLQPKGDGLFITQATYFSSDAYFDESGQKIDQRTFKKWELQPYAEYGLTNTLTVGGSLYAQQVSQSGDSNGGIGDPELFFRTRLWHNDRETLAIQPLIKLSSAYAHDTVPRGGSRSTDGELNLLYGRNLKLWWGLTGYTDMRVGYRVRSRGLNPQWRTDAAVGINLSEQWQIIPAFRSVIAAKYDDTGGFREDGEQDYDLYKIELTGLYNVDKKHWVHATLFDHVGGAFTGAGRGFTLGFAERF